MASYGDIYNDLCDRYSADDVHRFFNEHERKVLRRLGHPKVPDVVYLTAKQNIRDRLVREFEERGWLVAGDNQSWHLSRGGAHVVQVNVYGNQKNGVGLALVEAKFDGPAPAWKEMESEENDFIPKTAAGDIDAKRIAGWVEALFAKAR